MDRTSQTRKIPIEKRPSGAARVRTPPEGLRVPIIVPGKGQDITTSKVPLLHIKLVECIFPYEKHFVYGPKSVDLKFVIAVSAIDKQFEIVVPKYQRIALSQAGLHERLLAPECHVQKFVIPEGGCPGIVKAGLAGCHVDESRRLLGGAPRWV